MNILETQVSWLTPQWLKARVQRYFGLLTGNNAWTGTNTYGAASTFNATAAFNAGLTAPSGYDAKLNADNVGIQRRMIDVLGLAAATDHFRSGAIPTGYAWAGAPFTTPTVSYSYNSDYCLVTTGGGNRNFLYKSVTTYLNKEINARITVTHHAAVGFRYDDGTDNNYVEAYWNYTSAGQMQWTMTERSGGGAVTTTTGATALVNIFHVMRLFAYNNTGSNQQGYSYLVGESQQAAIMLNVASYSWAASRVGLLFSGIGGYAFVDWFSSNFT